MTFTLHISAELEAKLLEQAKLQGKPPEKLVLEALEDKFTSSNASPSVASIQCRRDSDRSTDLTPPDWLDVEQDVVLHLPYRWEPVQLKVIDAGTIQPADILPQEVADE
jgi:hypothetical protein